MTAAAAAKGSGWLAGSLRVVLALALPVAAPAQVRMGPEFRVNAYTTRDQWLARVAGDAAGNFLVVWLGDRQDGSEAGVFARWHDASGAPVGADDVRVNAHTPGGQFSPAVALTPDGRAVVVWCSDGQDGDDIGIFARQYASAEAAPGPEFRVNAYTTASQREPAVATDAVGNFVVVWRSRGQDGDANGYGIVGRRFDALAQPLGSEFVVNTYTTSSQSDPAVTADAAGNFVVVWVSSGQDGDHLGVFAQRYDATGAAIGGEFQVNSDTAGPQFDPSVASDANGNLVVAWQDRSSDIVLDDVWGQRYDAAGAAIGDAFRVNTYTTYGQSSPTVAMHPDGRFVVAWSDSSQGGNQADVLGRRYDAFGSPEGAVFRLNAYTTGHQAAPSLFADGAGNFVAVWHGDDGDGTHDVFAQRFASDLIFRDGFEDGTAGAWSTTADGGGDLSVAASAAMRSSTAGLRGVVDDAAGLYVQDDRPRDEDRYRARFWFDPNGFDPGEASNRFRTRIFIAFSEAPVRRVLAIVLRRIGGEYSIRARARLDDDSRAETPFIPITDAPHAIEFELRRAPSPTLNVGFLAVRIDGDVVASLTLLDNSLAEVDFVRMGALSVKAGASGTMYWDEFESRRQSAIGP